MIAKLFRRLTADPASGTAMFEWATRGARDRDWYGDGSIPDTIDGRFAMVSTVTALCCLRLEQLGAEGEALAVALTERFAQVMESEHRELGIGDPALGKTVLKLVGSLARRVDALRPAMTGNSTWAAAAAAALPPTSDEAETAWRAKQLERLARQLRSARIGELAQGAIR